MHTFIILLWWTGRLAEICKKKREHSFSFPNANSLTLRTMQCEREKMSYNMSNMDEIQMVELVFKMERN
jgi:hypothetical protein